VRFVGGGGFNGIPYHLNAGAAQAVGQQGAGVGAVVLLNQAQAQQVVRNCSPIVGNQHLGEAGIIVGIGRFFSKYMTIPIA
jgi:DNA topoisomerase VI subunit B